MVLQWRYNMIASLLWPHSGCERNAQPAAAYLGVSWCAQGLQCAPADAPQYECGAVQRQAGPLLLLLYSAAVQRHARCCMVLLSVLGGAQPG